MHRGTAGGLRVKWATLRDLRVHKTVGGRDTGTSKQFQNFPYNLPHFPYNRKMNMYGH